MWSLNYNLSIIYWWLYQRPPFYKIICASPVHQDDDKNHSETFRTFLFDLTGLFKRSLFLRIIHSLGPFFSCSGWETLTIPATLPTWPSFRRTLIPWGWNRECVRISCTTPRVVFPLRWSSFWIISTVHPTWMHDRCLPLCGVSMIRVGCQSGLF